MRPTRRSLESGLLAVLLAALAVLFDQPILLGATATIGAFLVGRQYRFVRAVTGVNDTLTVEQSPTTASVRRDDSIDVTIVASLEPSPLALELSPGLPTGVTVADTTESTADELEFALEPGETRATRTVTVTCPVVGRQPFEPATVTATDGWFTESIPAGSTPTITVEPRGPRTVHVGAGGDRASVVQGRHDSGRTGSGLTPAELREYVPGDTVARIDWNATARLSTPHVREYESETDRPTVLLVDHRDPLGTGPTDETKLDYLRDVALTIVRSARELGDPLALVTVGEEGITERVSLSTEPAQYRRIRTRLFDLEPTAGEPSRSIGPEASSPRSKRERLPSASLVGTASATLRFEPTPASEAVRTLDGGERDAFGRTLRPFYADRRRYRERTDGDPLAAAVRSTLEDRRSSPWLILCTDDASPRELRDAIRIARERDRELLVLLAPTVLFEPGELSDLEAAYESYLAFEEFRRHLDGLDGVTALEVAPDDRIATLLAAGRERRRAAVAEGER
ncbi:DUF58 domain-containing protein [Natrarchaeobius oligotrophus]|uniref:DUF58 domain-containing protein n=1 Tax=Natrarchaeobius chitinivorans TaxID=1679083 RepID=A0A3N6PS35_NATCH|nr:DUF58 domain-containing protein [Natrarchaeobius chitinivorans]RQH02276.1 DUF58 domain-containing protein [Natrarchaeobius chitinivorans]